jgi:hypothetical protein
MVASSIGLVTLVACAKDEPVDGDSANLTFSAKKTPTKETTRDGGAADAARLDGGMANAGEPCGRKGDKKCGAGLVCMVDAMGGPASDLLSANGSAEGDMQTSADADVPIEPEGTCEKDPCAAPDADCSASIEHASGSSKNDSDGRCTPGASVSCSCDDGTEGTSQFLATGDGYSGCSCD